MSTGAFSVASGRAAHHNTLLHTKTQYGESLAQLGDIFPDWTEEDLGAVLSELGGDLEIVIQRISQGTRALPSQPPSPCVSRPCDAVV